MIDAPVGRLVSVNVGMPRDVEWEERIVHTGIWKDPVDGRRMVRRLNVDGVYQIESYGYWQQFLGRDDFTYGQFGENFTSPWTGSRTTRSASVTGTGSARLGSVRGQRAPGHLLPRRHPDE